MPSDDANSIDEDLLTIASDCIEVITKQQPVSEQLTGCFVTNIIELNEQAVNKIKNQPSQDTTDNINLRFIRPSKTFYNVLMATWLRISQDRLDDVSLEEFLFHMRTHYGPERWREHIHRLPTEQYFSILKSEMQLQTSLNEEVAISSYFEGVKSKLF